MLRVGLTGGIGAGKSTVATRLAAHGAVLIDADVIAREVVEPGSPGLEEIVDNFGPDVLDADGRLNRSALAAKAFVDEESRTRLNAITHPRIGERTAELIAQAKRDAIVVHDIPLLVENGLAPTYHVVVVVDAPEEVRVRRLMRARGMDEADARARVSAQATEAERRAVADVWLDNSGPPGRIVAEVDALWADRLVPFEANVRLRRPRPPMAPRIVSYDESWPVQAERAIARIRLVMGNKALRVDHIGSTAVPGLPAKNVLDLQLTVSTLDDADAVADMLSNAGFLRLAGKWVDTMRDDERNRVSWEKRMHVGADPARPVNLHVRTRESPACWSALLFPAWLRANPSERDAYADVKRKLALAHRSDGSVDDYAEDKQEWLQAAFPRAEEWARRAGWEP